MGDLAIFTNKVALITGSGRGIGKSIALHFANLGSDIIINFYRNRKPAEDTAAEIRELGRRAWVIKANIGKIEDISFLYHETEKNLQASGIQPGIDYLIHNAASGFNRPVMEQKPKGWDWTMNINARS